MPALVAAYRGAGRDVIRARLLPDRYRRSRSATLTARQTDMLGIEDALDAAGLGALRETLVAEHVTAAAIVRGLVGSDSEAASVPGQHEQQLLWSMSRYAERREAVVVAGGAQ